MNKIIFSKCHNITWLTRWLRWRAGLYCEAWITNIDCFEPRNGTYKLRFPVYGKGFRNRLLSTSACNLRYPNLCYLKFLFLCPAG